MHPDPELPSLLFTPLAAASADNGDGAVPLDSAYARHEVLGEGLYLVGERTHHVVKDPTAARLARLADGTRTIDDIVDAVDGAVDAATAYYLIEELVAAGHLHEVHRPLSPAVAQLLATLEVSPTVAAERVGAAVVDVSGPAELGSRLFLDALASLGIRARVAERAAEDAALRVVLTDDYDRPELGDVDADARRLGRPWLLVRPAGTYLWIGPLFVPGRTGCWFCLRHRLRGNREVETYLRHKLGGADPVAPAPVPPAAVSAAAAGLVATRVLWWLASGGASPEPDRLVTLDLAACESKEHVLVRRPQCPACGDGSFGPDRVPGPVVLGHAPHPTDNDSGYRTVSPAQTLAHYERHVSPVIGAVTALSRIDSADDGAMHVYAAGHNFAMRSYDLRYLKAGLRNKSSGKGLTDDQAKVSALGEALERYQGLYTGEEPRRRARMADFGDDAVHPNAVMLWSDAQYTEREAWNAREHKFALVPEPFDPGLDMDWSPLWSLTHQRTRWLPTGMLYYAVPRPHDRFFFIACSNGAAAGNTLEEAVLQGMLELVERDAVAVWWYNRLRRPAYDLAAFGDPVIDRLVATYEAMDRPITVLDLTHDLGIPVAAAVSARRHGVTEDILLGFGAHLDPRLAVLRAIAEVNQFHPAVATHQPDGSGHYNYDDDESQLWWRTATLANQPHLVADPGVSRAPVSVGPRADLLDAIDTVRGRIEAAGHEVLVLDQTRPDIGFPTVKVVAPGLRHFWARYAPGRLYDVPVRLGWLAEPTAEADLNPIVMYL